MGLLLPGRLLKFISRKMNPNDPIDAFKMTLFDEEDDDLDIENKGSLKVASNVPSTFNVAKPTKLKRLKKKKKKRKENNSRNRAFEKFKQNQNLDKNRSFFIPPSRKRKRKEGESIVDGIFGSMKKSTIPYAPPRKKPKKDNNDTNRNNQISLPNTSNRILQKPPIQGVLANIGPLPPRIPGSFVSVNNNNNNINRGSANNQNMRTENNRISTLQRSLNKHKTIPRKPPPEKMDISRSSLNKKKTKRKEENITDSSLGYIDREVNNREEDLFILRCGDVERVFPQGGYRKALRNKLKNLTCLGESIEESLFSENDEKKNEVNIQIREMSERIVHDSFKNVESVDAIIEHMRANETKFENLANLMKEIENYAYSEEPEHHHHQQHQQYQHRSGYGYDNEERYREDEAVVFGGGVIGEEDEEERRISMEF